MESCLFFSIHSRKAFLQWRWAIKYEKLCQAHTKMVVNVFIFCTFDTNYQNGYITKSRWSNNGSANMNGNRVTKMIIRIRICILWGYNQIHAQCQIATFKFKFVIACEKFENKLSLQNVTPKPGIIALKCIYAIQGRDTSYNFESRNRKQFLNWVNWVSWVNVE